MKVIVAGCPKTGTKSVHAALKQLGYTVYDFVEHSYCLENEWAGVFEHGWDKNTFYNMYKSIDAAVDLPASLFWEQIHEAFPDAKIILTVRDSEEEWLDSFKNHFRKLDSHLLIRIEQIVEVVIQRKAGLLLTMAYKFGFDVDRAVFRRKTVMNNSILKMRYRAHNERVMQKAPADKLLIFNCKDGWKPLCKFLQAEVPDGQFPHENLKGAIVDETVNHPLASTYSKEIAISSLQFLAKLVLAVGIALYIMKYVV